MDQEDLQEELREEVLRTANGYDPAQGHFAYYLRACLVGRRKGVRTEWAKVLTRELPLDDEMEDKGRFAHLAEAFAETETGSPSQLYERCRSLLPEWLHTLFEVRLARALGLEDGRPLSPQEAVWELEPYRSRLYRKPIPNGKTRPDTSDEKFDPWVREQLIFGILSEDPELRPLAEGPPWFPGEWPA